MNVVFFGSSSFSVPVLSALEKSSHRVIGVVTVLPKRKGRGQKELPTVVQEWAKSKSIPVAAPEKINSPEFNQIIRAWKPDSLVVASYGKMIPDSVLSAAKHYPLNVHPSLLPRYRGAAPIARQLLHGETKSGVTIARITSKLDAGEIIAQREIEILMDDNGISLALRLAKLGGELAADVLDRISSGQVALIEQNEADATYAEKLTASMGRIDWTNDAAYIARQVRALLPWPAAFTFLGKLRIKILEAFETNQPEAAREVKAAAGELIAIDPSGYLTVQAGRGAVRLKMLQPDSGKAMNAHAFALGRHLKPGERFS